MTEKNETITETTQENTAPTEAEAAPKSIFDPEEQIRRFAQGKMTLRVPIQDGQKTVTELNWDFLALTGAEYVDAMDMDARNSNTFRISATQALNLFAVAAAKATGGVDATDIRQRLSIMDTQKATQLATIFFTASNRVGNRNISEM